MCVTTSILVTGTLSCVDLSDHWYKEIKEIDPDIFNKLTSYLGLLWVWSLVGAGRVRTKLFSFDVNSDSVGSIGSIGSNRCTQPLAKL